MTTTYVIQGTYEGGSRVSGTNRVRSSGTSTSIVTTQTSSAKRSGAVKPATRAPTTTARSRGTARTGDVVEGQRVVVVTNSGGVPNRTTRRV